MADDTASTDETTRLLNTRPSPTSHPHSNNHKSSGGKNVIAITPWRIILSAAAAAVLLMLNIGSDMQLQQQQQRCSVDAVQSEVAYINGWKDSFEFLPAMLLVLPYGVLTDRIGRKPVLLLAIVGCILNNVWIRVVYWFSDVFPLRAVWFGGLWQVIGAGTVTFSSVFYVLVADVCPAEQRIVAFAHLQTAALFSKLVFVPTGGAMLAVNPWLPMFISSVFLLAGLCATVLFVPELCHPHHDRHASKAGSLGRRIRAHMASSGAFVRWLAKNRSVVLLMPCFFLISLGEQSNGTLLLQYASKQLGWSLADASYLLSLAAGVHLFDLIILVPTISTFLIQQLHLHEAAKDKRVAQLCVSFLVGGSMALFLGGTSSTWIMLGQLLMALGLAIAIPGRSMLTGIVEPRHLGALYTSVSVLTYGGILVGGPLLANVFHWGMSLGDFWIGLPFFVSAGCFAVTLVVISVADVAGDVASDIGGPEGDGLA
ncbi:major facilitator superfamily domain-containing protein [Podospora appendiculata]|uniref:Major facilitator superfamily domain-containing protein n=1 Tax=Podospora appendiculata TaxID=314037 RepID=A0AAE1C8L6_9PEZI|nr:major facilitator superfamily domain-containing protein [Podospora appendiculata]